MPTVVHQFNDANPFDVDKLNDSLAALVGAVNALAGDSQVQLSPAPGNDGSFGVPVAGGGFLGQISAPSILVGDPEGTQYLVLTKEDVLSIATLGSIASGTYQQSELQAVIDKLDALIGALKA